MRLKTYKSIVKISNYGTASKERGIMTHGGSRVGVSAGRCGVSVVMWKMHALNEFAYFEYIQTLIYEDE
jgi:hypothetical protein